MNFHEYKMECERIWKVPIFSLKLIYAPQNNSKIIGLCSPSIRTIKIMPMTHYPEEIIVHILVHELAHYVDWYRNGGWRTKKGRTRYHDKVFRSILQEVANVHPTWTQDLTKRGLVCQ